jgi:hypothetical protein
MSDQNVPEDNLQVREDFNITHRLFSGHSIGRRHDFVHDSLGFMKIVAWKEGSRRSSTGGSRIQDPE